VSLLDESIEHLSLILRRGWAIDVCSVRLIFAFVLVNERERKGWMSQSSSEKFLYFTVGLLKGSAALDALRQDATKHHMVDQPGQLIALRITEYYEMMNQGIVQPVVRVPAVLLPLESEQMPSAENSASPQPFPIPFQSPASLTNVLSQQAPAPVFTPSPSFDKSEPESALSQLTGRASILRQDNENVVSVSSAAEKNADEAADYWSTL
jgi:hypothetical protein